MKTMKVNSKIADITAGSTGGFISLEGIGEVVQNTTIDPTEQTLINSVVAIVVGLVTTGIKDLFSKIFKKKDKKSNRAK